jgi:DNA-binding SARP family transcriptional activator
MAGTRADSMVSPPRQRSAPAGSAPPDGPRAARLTLLGGFGLHVGDDAVSLAPGPQRLAALLALHGSALHRGYVAGVLWGDSTEARAHASLRSTLWKLQAARPRLVWISGDNVGLSPDVEVDVRLVTRYARALVTGHFDEETVIALLEPRFCYELLPGWYDDWVIVERERHRQLSLHALESVCEYLTSVRRYGAAVLAGLAAVDREPLRESAHRALMKVHLAEGNAVEAIRRYRHYEKIAARDLGIEPSPMMRSLLSQIPAPDVRQHAASDGERVPAPGALPWLGR